MTAPPDTSNTSFCCGSTGKYPRDGGNAVAECRAEAAIRYGRDSDAAAAKPNARAWLVTQKVLLGQRLHVSPRGEYQPTCAQVGFGCERVRMRADDVRTNGFSLISVHTHPGGIADKRHFQRMGILRR